MTQIPAAVDEVFRELKTELTWLYGRWIIYRQLYAHSKRRIDLLNESASAFFYVIRDALADEIQVTISRLTDPAKTGRHDNLTFEQLQLRVDGCGGQALATTLRPLLTQLRDKCSAIRAHRNKRLAHLDLGTALKNTPDPLPGVSRK
jgi:hypothetical protein